MLRYSTLIVLVASSLFCLSCANDTVVQTGSVEVQWDEDSIGIFQAAERFSVLTSEIVPPDELPDLEDDQIAFNEKVNAIIIEEMQAEPVCLTYIEPNEVTDQNQPDLWAANGLSQTEEGGWIYQCVGGWWWGYWGWYWDSCAYWRPTWVNYEVGSLLIPVGPPPADGEEPKLIFAGLAQSVVGTGPTADEKIRAAVRLIFDQWPVKNVCPQ